MTPDPSTARITVREVYDAVMSLRNELQHTPRMVDDHEQRLRDLEKRVWSAAGIATVSGVIISQLISMLGV
jgi:hypothetical protein